jgi:hypothetical protein
LEPAWVSASVVLRRRASRPWAWLPKPGVAGSSPVVRFVESRQKPPICGAFALQDGDLCFGAHLASPHRPTRASRYASRSKEENAMAVEQLGPGDLDVLEFIGQRGRPPAQIDERFPTADLERLVRIDLIRRHLIELRQTGLHGPSRSPDAVFYVLTARGAEVIGIDPGRLHAA